MAVRTEHLEKTSLDSVFDHGRKISDLSSIYRHIVLTTAKCAISCFISCYVFCLHICLHIDIAAYWGILLLFILICLPVLTD
jgi:hypothetical protein